MFYKLGRGLAFGGLLWLMLLVGCAPSPSPTATARPTDSIAPSKTPTPTITPIPTDTPTPPPTTPSPSEVFQRVAPSVAFIDTPRQGSAILVEGGYLITSATAVWPFQHVRVVFPDGTEFEDAPVLDLDLIANLAVIGPVDTQLPPLTPIPSEDIDAGTRVFLVGYPSESDPFPQPALSQGLVSHTREWDRAKLTYFQTDTTIAGGSSGGVLFSQAGQVMGLGGWTLPDSQFSVILSIIDALPRAKKMIMGEDVDGLSWDILSNEKEAATSHWVSLRHEWEQQAFAVIAEPGTKIQAEFLASDNAALSFFVKDIFGIPLPVNDAGEWIASKGNFTIQEPAPYFLVVISDTGDATGKLKTNTPVFPISRWDEQIDKLETGDEIRGSLDFPGDLDIYGIWLKKDERVYIRVESAMIDAWTGLVPAKDSPLSMIEDIVAEDDNSGDGVFDSNAALVYQAPMDAGFLIFVADLQGNHSGGYILTVTEPDETAPTPIIPTPTPTPIFTKAGKMRLYRSSGPVHYVLPYPAALLDVTSNPSLCPPLFTACFVREPWTKLHIMEASRDKSTIPLDHEALVKELKATMTSGEGNELIYEDTFLNAEGLQVTVLKLAVEDETSFGNVHLWLIIHGRGDTALVASYMEQDFSTFSEQSRRSFQAERAKAGLPDPESAVRYMADHLAIEP